MSPIISSMMNRTNMDTEELAVLVKESEEYHKKLAEEALDLEGENINEFAEVQETETPEVTEPQA